MTKRPRERPATPTPRPARLEDILQGPLAAQIEGMEVWRKRTRSAMLGWTAAIVLPGSAVVFGLAHVGMHHNFVLFAAIGVLVAAVAMAGHHYQRYRSSFKRRVVAPIIAAFHPGLAYQPDGAIPRATFEASGLFRELPVSQFEGEDLVSGQIGATAIRFCEVAAVHVTRRGKSDTQQTIFRGLFFAADFNKHFKGSTYVLPDRAQRLLGALGQGLQGLDSTYGQLVKLEDPEFERLFAVYASDQIEARYILSSALMARISGFRVRSGHPLRLGFVDSQLYVAIEIGRDLFEPRLFRSVADADLYREIWNDLDLVIGIVDELNLNSRIWTKR